MSQFGVVLIATDFSVESDQAFHVACDIARSQCARLVVLHVIPRFSLSDADAETALDPYEVNEAWPAVRECRNQFERLQKLSDGILSTYRVVVGYPVGMILNVARQEEADLIVIASHQGRHYSFQLHGPVSEGVLKQAHCPVLCLRQPNSCATGITNHRFGNVDALS